ncbi:DUF805 domain-containing protein [uncultured Litoreibacter sp.]|uniref:DUF805 domain-containing protein n=1 Tax=uncultured Litoreibacter sp. TaxID=1392394 RepID=UPI00262BCDF4|nr:DUF805 domain-containing protein [uncultured Litoreibacter sp.]
MGPVRALGSCISQSFRWRGRASRSEFWWFFLIYTGGFIAYVIYAAFSSVVINETTILPVVIYVCVMFFPLIAVMVRRLHDKGLTGFLLILGVVPFGQLALLILALLPGDIGPNGYGDDPLGRSKPEGITYGSSRVPLVRDDD